MYKGLRKFLHFGASVHDLGILCQDDEKEKVAGTS